MSNKCFMGLLCVPSFFFCVLVGYFKTKNRCTEGIFRKKKEIKIIYVCIHGNAIELLQVVFKNLFTIKKNIPKNMLYFSVLLSITSKWFPFASLSSFLNCIGKLSNSAANTTMSSYYNTLGRSSLFYQPKLSSNFAHFSFLVRTSVTRGAYFARQDLCASVFSGCLLSAGLIHSVLVFRF